MRLFLVSAAALVWLAGCANKTDLAGPSPESPDTLAPYDLAKFPDFITKNEDYYITRISQVPQIDSAAYVLKVHGLVDSSRNFTLHELYGMPLAELPLTVECIGNSANGHLLSTAVWKGFYLYDFLATLGIRDSATGVKYLAADGYYASHTLDQVRDNHILCALYMNGEIIPPVQGYPLRVLNPGYYGVKQPAWVTDIEVIGRPLEDFWGDRGWDVSPPIAVDAVIFYPASDTQMNAGDTLELGGAAFGGTRVTRVEVTLDHGGHWQEAEIVKSMDADNVWVFWGARVVFPDTGDYTLNVRATDIHGNVQPDDDPEVFDGTNDWPLLRVSVNP